MTDEDKSNDLERQMFYVRRLVLFILLSTLIVVTTFIIVTVMWVMLRGGDITPVEALLRIADVIGEILGKTIK